MTNTFSPTIIEGLSTRESIIDSLQRVVLAIDTADGKLYKSAVVYSPESFFAIAGGRKIEGSDALDAYLIGHIFPLTTLHHLTNIRVFDIDELKGTARVTSSSVAYHYRPEDAFKGEGRGFVTGGRYEIDVLKDDDGAWKIKGWTLHLHWTEGDREVVFGQ